MGLVLIAIDIYQGYGNDQKDISDRSIDTGPDTSGLKDIGVWL